MGNLAIFSLKLKEDPHFKERDTRKKNRYVLKPLLDEKLMEQNTDYWVEILNKNDIPSGAILDLGNALSTPQVEHRKTFEQVAVEGIGDLKLFNITAKFDKTPGGVEAPPPLLSQHTEAILTGIGYTLEEIKGFKENQIV